MYIVCVGTKCVVLLSNFSEIVIVCKNKKKQRIGASDKSLDTPYHVKFNGK